MKTPLSVPCLLLTFLPLAAQQPADRAALLRDQVAAATEQAARLSVQLAGFPVLTRTISELGSGEIVKNAPYSATAVTTSTQTLSDGTHIHNSSSYRIYRDAEGRQRRETGNEIWISDPVAGASYVLNPRTHTYSTTPYTTFSLTAPSPGYASFSPAPGREGPVVESLPARTLEGVNVYGTRRTTTIPDKSIGNDRPINVVTDTWFSPELEADIQSTTTDPRSGEEKFELTDLSRNPPAPSLFQVPADYHKATDFETLKGGGH